MIPCAEILDEIDDVLISPDSEIEKMMSVFQFLVGRLDVWKDPFFLIKSKCPPTVPPQSVTTVEIHYRYLCQVFPLSKIENVSFERSQMANLFVDTNGRLIQLLFLTENTSEPKPGFEYVEVIEYHTPLGVFLARKNA